MNSISSSLYEFQDPAFPPALSGEHNIMGPECEFDRLFKPLNFDIVNRDVQEQLSINPAQYFFNPDYEEKQAIDSHQVTHEDVALQGMQEKGPSPLKGNRSLESKKHYEKHKAEISERRKQRYQENKNKILESVREYKKNNKDKVLKSAEKYRKTHREEIQEKREIKKAVEKLFLSQPAIFDNFPVNLPLDKLPNLA